MLPSVRFCLWTHSQMKYWCLVPRVWWVTRRLTRWKMDRQLQQDWDWNRNERVCCLWGARTERQRERTEMEPIGEEKMTERERVDIKKVGGGREESEMRENGQNMLVFNGEWRRMKGKASHRGGTEQGNLRVASVHTLLSRSHWCFTWCPLHRDTSSTPCLCSHCTVKCVNESNELTGIHTYSTHPGWGEIRRFLLSN